ncbi:MAG: replicative DNA helicase [Bacteroidia bacterium]
MTDRKKHIPAAQTEPLLPPAAVELEEAVLGALLVEKNAMLHASILNEQSFYKLEHQYIFKSIRKVIKAGGQPDILTVTEQLLKEGELKMVGGPGYIARLTNKVASAAHVEYHCFILKEKEIARKFIEAGSKLIKLGYDPTQDVFKTEEMAAQMIGEIMNISAVKHEIDNNELAHQFIKRMEESHQKNGIIGVPTGFREYDILTGGLQKKDLIILAARPGMGKTALALCIFLNAVIFSSKRFIIFSLEMGAIQLFQRMCAIYMGIDANKFRSGNLTNGEWKYFHNHLEPLLNKNLIIVDDCRTLHEIRMRIKKERIKGELDGGIVDYLQLVEIAGEKSREQEVSKISRGLKTTAMEEDIPIIALCQLSRAVETRSTTNKRPQLSDLRESGSIEQDADQVLFIYRPNYYGLAEPGKEHVALLCVEKHRNGSLQDIELAYIHNQTKFVNLDSYNPEIDNNKLKISEESVEKPNEKIPF